MLKSTVALFIFITDIMMYYQQIFLMTMTQDVLTTVDHLFCLNQKLFPIRSVRNTDGITIQRALFLDDTIAYSSTRKNSRKYKERLCLTWLMSHAS